MPRRAVRDTFGRSCSSEDSNRPEALPVGARGAVASGDGLGGAAGPPATDRSEPRPGSVVVLSVLGAAGAVAAAGGLSALIYPILKELRAERVRGQDGTEERMLGFWSILVLSVLVGCVCCVFSWTLSFFDTRQPGMVFPTPLILAHFRDVSGHGLHMGYGVAVLNGIMAMLTVIWSLT